MQKTRLTILVFAIGVAAMLASATTSAQKIPTRDQPDAGAGVVVATTQPQARQTDLGAAIAALDQLIRAPMPLGLTRAEQDNWREQTAWLTSVRDRYRTLSRSYSAIASNASPATEAAAPAIPGGAVVSAAVSNVGRERDADGTARAAVGSPAPDGAAQLSMQFSALQSTLEAEIRRFQTLSNASKLRHDTAKNIIQNLKA
jgi:hypothetical protein